MPDSQSYRVLCLREAEANKRVVEINSCLTKCHKRRLSSPSPGTLLNNEMFAYLHCSCENPRSPTRTAAGSKHLCRRRAAGVCRLGPRDVLSICTRHNPRELREIQERSPKARRSSHRCNVTIKPVYCSLSLKITDPGKETDKYSDKTKC
ncbi:uncharacterized protein WM294_003977 [Sarcoramphus papa]